MRCSKRIISFLVCFATVFSFAVVPSLAVDGEYDFDAELDKEFISSTVPALVTKLGLTTMVGYDYSSDGYTNMFADILNNVAEVQDYTRENVYSGVKLPPRYEYEYARDSSDLGKYFRSVGSIGLAGADALSYYFRLPASEIQSFSDDLYELLGVRLQGTYVNSAGGYVYRVIFDESKVAENVGNHFYYMGLKYFLALDPSSAALNLLDPLGVLEWNGLVDHLIGGVFEQSKFLTAPNGCIIVGVQGDSAATTENKYYQDTNKTEVNVEGDTSYNVEIRDSGNTTTNIPIDLSNMVYYDFQSGTYNAIDTLVYDAGDQTYTINNHFELTFHYNYTYYVQIGETEEYVGAYEVYFELPDGRNSKDLTEDEIFGLAKDAGFVNFDVVNENPDLLALFPLDGNLDNIAESSSAMEFFAGASSTYLETDNFGGALFVPTGAYSHLNITPVSYRARSYSYDTGHPLVGTINFDYSLPHPSDEVTTQFRLYFEGMGNAGDDAMWFPSAWVPVNCDVPALGNSMTANIDTTGSVYNRLRLVWDSDGSAHFEFRQQQFIGPGWSSNAPVVSSESFVVSGVWNDFCIEFSHGEPRNYWNSNGALTHVMPVNLAIWVNGHRVLSSWTDSAITFGFILDGENPPNRLEAISGNFTLYNFLPSFIVDSYASYGGYRLDNLRIVGTELYDHSMTQIPVAGQPFDSNKILVLPDDTSDLITPTIAVYSDIPVGETRIGGVRPSIPKKGDVYCYVENNRITSIQQHDGSGWLEVGGMIWTGSKWVDPGAYDVIRYAELWDVSEDEAIKDAVTTTNSTLGKILDVLNTIRDGLFSRLDAILAALGVSSDDPTSSCEHSYSSEITTDPGCVEPGYQTYTCDQCGHQYTEIIDAHGHDWITTGSVPDVLDEEGSVIEEGYDELTCSVCNAKAKDYGDGPEEQDLFDALGDFIADGITWILDKLTELVDSLKGITDTFTSFVEKIKVMAGDYPAFFGAFVALIPGELATLMWFALIAWVVVAVWKKWSK